PRDPRRTSRRDRRQGSQRARAVRRPHVGTPQSVGAGSGEPPAPAVPHPPALAGIAERRMGRHLLRGAAAIAGLGITPQGKVYGTNAIGFAADAVRLALDDAGLARTDLDGLLVNPGLTWNDQGMGSFQLQHALRA